MFVGLVDERGLWDFNAIKQFYTKILSLIQITSNTCIVNICSVGFLDYIYENCPTCLEDIISYMNKFSDKHLTEGFILHAICTLLCTFNMKTKEGIRTSKEKHEI